MSRRLYHFHGGLRLADRKQASTCAPITRPPLPRRLWLPLHQHIGEAAEPLVKAGERVAKGQMIARASAFVSAPLHAPSSGTVVEITEHAVPHVSGLKARTLVIETDGEDRWTPLEPIEDYTQIDLNQLRNRIRSAGIVGLGGAAFPTSIKVNPGPNRNIDTVILNGAECEPYISCDDMLMRERPEEIIAGAHILMHISGARQCLIAIEDNKPQAIASMQSAIADHDYMEVVEIPTVYPSGGEKQLIQILTGREVPSHRLPADVGVVCNNVGTAAAVHRAINLGEPLISRVITVTGGGVERPRNLEVLIGTPMNELLEFCGLSDDDFHLIMGGPMMGFTVLDHSVPVIKASNCLLAATELDMPATPPPMPCIRCARCAEACPASLLPQQLYWHCRSQAFDKAQDYNLFDCIECGCCAYVCPSHIPLVQYYRYAKTAIWAKEREKAKADQARERMEFRKFRLEREQQERAARHAEKKAALKKPARADSAQASIEAAVERAEQKRQQRQPSSASSERVEQLRELSARRKTRAEPAPDSGKQLSADQRAIIEKAKAREKARQEEDSSRLPTDASDETSN
jgi:electron transport complex protein RnfC